MFTQNNQNNQNSQNKNFNKNNNRFNGNYNNKNKPARANVRNFARSPEELKQQLMPLYSRSMSYGRTAMMKGDYIEAERHFQQAEHYMRTMNISKGSGNGNARQPVQEAQASPKPSSTPVSPKVSSEGGPETILSIETKPDSGAQVAVQVTVEPVPVPAVSKTPDLSETPSSPPPAMAEAPKKRRGRPPKNRSVVGTEAPSKS